MVRGENSLVSAILTGKPFLWDIYLEKNGAHREKMADFGKFVDTLIDWSSTLSEFLESENTEASLEKLFSMEKEGFEKMAEVVRKRDILETLLRYCSHRL